MKVKCSHNSCYWFDSMLVLRLFHVEDIYSCCCFLYGIQSFLNIFSFLNEDRSPHFIVFAELICFWSVFMIFWSRSLKKWFKNRLEQRQSWCYCVKVVYCFESMLIHINYWSFDRVYFFHLMSEYYFLCFSFYLF